jgi:hypothetical protein
LSQLVGTCPAQCLQETQQVILGPFMLIASSETYCGYYYYLLQLSFHSVAVVLTLVTNKNKYT